MPDSDIEHKLEMSSSADSSTNDSDVTAPLHPLGADSEEASLNSRLDQQLDAAFRDVEDLFEATLRPIGKITAYSQSPRNRLEYVEPCRRKRSTL